MSNSVKDALRPLDMRDQYFAEQFLHSMRVIGFAVIRNHGVNLALIREVLAMWERYLFSLSQAEKDILTMPSIGTSPCGYVKGGKGSLGKVVDKKEYFYLQPFREDFQKCANQCFPNSSTLYRGTLDLIEQQITLCTSLAQIIEDALSDQYPALKGVAADVASSDFGAMRVNYFPPFDGSEPKETVPAAVHRDLCFLTALPASAYSGLWVMDNDLNRYDLHPPEDCMIINAGEHCSILTGGKFDRETGQVGIVDENGIQTGAGEIPGTLHGVDGDPSRSAARMSIPWFANLSSDFVLDDTGLTGAEIISNRLSRQDRK